MYHIKNVHEWEDHSLFKECEHREYTWQDMKSKAWLKKSSFAYAALKEIILNKRLLNDLKYLTDINHTVPLEVYRSPYKKYSPKRLHFSYPVMIARAHLAALDFNSRFSLAHRKNKERDLQYKYQFSKITQSWVVIKIERKRKGNAQKSYHG